MPNQYENEADLDAHQANPPVVKDAAANNMEIPRVVIHLPAWLNQFQSLSRGFKLALMSVALAGTVGVSVYVATMLPDDISSKTPQLNSAKTFKGLGAPAFGEAPPAGVVLDPALGNLADLVDPLSKSDIPFYLHIPRSGGLTVQRILGQCFGLVQTSDIATKMGNEGETLEIIHSPSVGSIVNVDTYSPDGIARARVKGLTSSGLVGSIASPNLYEASSLFATDHRGRMYLMIRHPVERAVSYFHYIQKSAWDPNFSPLLKSISISDYVGSAEDRPEYNYLTKLLSNNVNKDSSELTLGDLNIAKEVLRRKSIVGLLNAKHKSLTRFRTYFGWSEPAKTEDCENALSQWIDKNDYPTITDKDPVYHKFVEKNKFDMDLYTFAVKLFSEQGLLIASMGSPPV